MMIDEDTFSFRYSVTTDEGTVNGLGWAVIEAKEGQPFFIKGIFYQLPPYKALFGNLEFAKDKTHLTIR